VVSVGLVSSGRICPAQVGQVGHAGREGNRRRRLDDQGGMLARRKTLELIHPVYLDIPMMVSFVAALEGGVSYGDEVTERSVKSRSGEGEGTGKAGVPSLANLFGLKLDLTGRLKYGQAGEDSTEKKIVREHTAASLFNLLLNHLEDSKVVLSIENDDLTDVGVGQLVEVRGEVLGNPWETMLDTLFQILPFMGFDAEGDKSVPANRETRRKQARSQSGGRPAPSPIDDQQQSEGGFGPNDVRLLEMILDPPVAYW
jgi:hypothetical protein